MTLEGLSRMGPNDQGWLYRQGDLILGPVSAKIVVEKLFSGELSPGTEVQLMGSGVFKKIVDVPEFKVHVAKAAAKQRVDAQSMAETRIRNKRMTKLVGAGAVLILAALLVVVGLGNYLAIHAGADDSLEITVDAPKISAAQRMTDDEMLEYTSTGRKPPSVAARANQGPGNGNSGTGKPKMGQADEEGMAMSQVDESAITATVSRYKPTLIPCLKLVAKPGMVAKVPIEFAIGDGGKVSKVWVDNPDFKDGPLPECLLKELQKWPFKTADGSGGTVKLSFNIGSRG